MRGRNIGPRLAEKVACKVFWDRYTLQFYSVDASSYSVRPLAVAFPEGEKDIAAIMRFASRYGIPVVPRGAGTGLVGGGLGRGIILDMRNFNRIRVGSTYVQAGAGVYKGDLDRALKKAGRFLGPNPSIGPFCTVGGMVGTNASGSHSIKYGSIADNLASVRLVTSEGKVVELPKDSRLAKKILETAKPGINRRFPAVSKNSCGYRIDKIAAKSDTQKIIAGSEGTLGVITAAKLRIVPIPRKTVLMIAAYDSLKTAAREVPKILRIGPSAVEMVDGNIARHIRSGIVRGKQCLLFVEFDDDTARKRRECKRALSGRIIASTSHAGRIAKWWAYRNSALAYSLRSTSPDEVNFSLIEDATVPVHRLPLLLDLVDHLVARYPMRVTIYGHAGNGNLHIRPVLKKKESRLIGKIAKEFFAGVVSMGGTITGEHGDGLARTPFVKMQYGAETYDAFRKIKRIFDPKGILNPGKIVLQA